jgi:hypothetical protein
MERYLVHIDRHPAGPSQAHKQRRIEDMGKIVMLPKARICVDSQELQRLHKELTDDAATTEKLVKALRQLGCYAITANHLEEVQLAKAVKQLRNHPAQDVRRLADNWLDKVKQDVLQDHRRRSRKITAFCNP